MNDTWTYASPWTVSDGKKIVAHRRDLATPKAHSFAYAKEECFPTPASLPKETRVMAQKGARLTAANVPKEASAYPGGRPAFIDQFADKGYFRVGVVFRNADTLTAVSKIPG